MSGLGSGENGEFTFLDILAILGFCVSMKNLDINLTQDDIAQATAELDEKVNEHLTDLLNEIHSHLYVQDKKIDLIINRLEANSDDKDKTASRRNA